MHAGRVLFSLARYFDWWQNRMVTEFEIDGLREDLVIVSRSGYVTVVEIKVSRADWQADRHKNRWPSDSISRFFYAVPFDLYQAGVPAHVPQHCGILSVRQHRRGGFDTVREERAARRHPALKLKAEKQRQLDQTFYFRFWRMHMDREQRRLIDRAAPVQRPANALAVA
jgi:hypothetical protein